MTTSSAINGRACIERVSKWMSDDYDFEPEEVRDGLLQLIEAPPRLSARAQKALAELRRVTEGPDRPWGWNDRGTRRDYYRRVLGDAAIAACLSMSLPLRARLALSMRGSITAADVPPPEGRDCLRAVQRALHALPRERKYELLKIVADLGIGLGPKRAGERTLERQLSVDVLKSRILDHCFPIAYSVPTDSRAPELIDGRINYRGYWERPDLAKANSTPPAPSVLDSDCPGSITILVPGFANTKQSNLLNTHRFKTMLNSLGYRGAVVGFDWAGDALYTTAVDRAPDAGALLARAIRSIKSKCRGIKINIVAHSMGALVPDQARLNPAMSPK